MIKLNFSVFLIVTASFFIQSGCQRPSGDKQIVIYTSQDATYAKHILKDFELSSGIKVLVVHDSEVMKTVGLAQRLILEAKAPRCDVFWSNEELKTRQLAEKGILQKPIHTTVFRTRHILINTNLISESEAPKSFEEFVNPEFKNRICMAYPLFGTTGNHFQGLRLQWGEKKWKEFCSQLKQNEVHVVDGNSHVVKLVGTGQKAIGITDFDDVIVGKKSGFPIHSFSDSESGMTIYNSLAPVLKSPNKENGILLINYLKSAAINQSLIDLGAAEGQPDTENNESQFSEDQWTQIISGIDTYQEYLESLFIK